MIYTTLGLGDLVPSGSIRRLARTRAPVGFMPISRSAAFAFPETERLRHDSTERRARAAYGTGHGRDDGG